MKTRKNLLSANALAILPLLFGSLTAQAQQSTHDFTVRCTSTGQLCTPASEVKVNSPSSARLQVQFTMPPACSSIRLHFWLDGKRIASSDFFSSNTGWVDLGEVQAGEHSILIQAEGRAGGCNTGQLVAWGGRLVMNLSGAGSSQNTNSSQQQRPQPTVEQTLEYINKQLAEFPETSSKCRLAKQQVTLSARRDKLLVRNEFEGCWPTSKAYLIDDIPIGEIVDIKTRTDNVGIFIDLRCKDNRYCAHSTWYNLAGERLESDNWFGMSLSVSRSDVAQRIVNAFQHLVQLLKGENKLPDNDPFARPPQ